MIPNQLTIHHSASGFNTTIKDIDAWHKVRNFTFSSLGYYVGYHYVILGDGSIVQTRRDNEMGCHSIPNDGKIGICLVGNFQIDQPRVEQINALENLCAKLQTIYNIRNVRGHRDCNLTECPGNNLEKFALIQEINILQKLLLLLTNKTSTNV